MAGRVDCRELLSDETLLINTPKKIVDRMNLKICSNRKFISQFLAKRPPISPNCGIIVVNEPFRFDSLFGVTNGIPITFDEDFRNEVLKFAKEDGHLLKGSSLIFFISLLVRQSNDMCLGQTASVFELLL